MARLVSLIVAVVTALAGHGLLFFASFYLQRSLTSYVAFAVPGFVVPLALLGILLIGITALTAAWSSLGVLIVGIVEFVVGAFGAVVPPALGGSPRNLLSRALQGAGPLGQTADLWLAVGASLVEGALLLGLAWAASRRRRTVVARPGIARVVAVLVTLIALGPATLLAVLGGYRNETRMFVRFAGPDPVGLVLLILGVVLLVALIACVRWSGLGAIVWGAALTLSSLSLGIVPALLPPTVAARGPNPSGLIARSLPPELASGILTNLAIGSIAVVGVTFLFGGIASVRAGRLGHRRQTFVAAPTGEVAEVVPGSPGTPA